MLHDAHLLALIAAPNRHPFNAASLVFHMPPVRHFVTTRRLVPFARSFSSIAAPQFRQGMTLDKVECVLGNAFADGQVYVALSRVGVPISSLRLAVSVCICAEGVRVRM